MQAYHRGEGKGKGKSLEVKKEPQFPQAPWWTGPQTNDSMVGPVQTIQEIHDDSEDSDLPKNKGPGGFRAFGP